MIVREFYTTREDGVDLYRTYSDANMRILQNETQIEYDDAIDIDGAPYTYSETNKPISDFGSDEISDSEALAIITGEIL
jgi:hypothetical protein